MIMYASQLTVGGQSVLPSGHGAPVWGAILVFCGLFTAYGLLAGWLIVSTYRLWRHGWDGENGGGGGGGTGPTPSDPPPDAEPEWWPTFEREFRDYADRVPSGC
jgi:hypothetical protein